MSMLDTINRKWSYKSERKDRWYILPVDTAKIEGDCEDYSLTVFCHHVCGGSLSNFLKAFVKGDAKMHFVMAKTQGGTRGGHAVLEVRGYGFIDNWSKAFISKDEMINTHHHVFKKKYWSITVFYRLLKAWL